MPKRQIPLKNTLSVKFITIAQGTCKVTTRLVTAFRQGALRQQIRKQYEV